MKLDLHVHTRASADSPETLENMISAAKSAGLDGIAVTDHDCFSNVPKNEEFILIPACEYTTDGGHMLAYFINGPIDVGLEKDEKGRYPWREIVRRAHEMGGLVFLAHPYAPEMTRDDELFASIDGIEGYNARIEHSLNRKANLYAQKKASELNLPVSAGSDGHYSREVGAAYFECDVTADTHEDKLSQIYSALKRGEGRIYGGRAKAIWKVKSGWLKTRRLRDWKRIPKLIPRTVRGILLSFLPKKSPQYIDLTKERTENDSL